MHGSYRHDIINNKHTLRLFLFSLMIPPQRHHPVQTTQQRYHLLQIMFSATACAAVLLAIVGIAAANPRMVNCVDYTDEANQKVIQYYVEAINI